VQLLGLWFVPESLHWLVSKDRGDEALQILGKYHAEGDVNDALVQFEFNEIKDALAYEQSTSRGSWHQGYLEFTRSAGNRKRLFILLWSACFAQVWVSSRIPLIYIWSNANSLVPTCRCREMPSSPTIWPQSSRA
jgi:hypothetical protein